MSELIVECGVLYDGTPSEWLTDARLRLSDGRITAAGPREAVDRPDSATVHDYGDKVVIPGLIDAHLHLDGDRTMDRYRKVAEWNRTALRTARAVRDCQRLLAAGYTTVRDVGSSVGPGLREAIREGEVPGPRIQTSGRQFSQTGGHADAHFLPQEWVAAVEPKRIVDGPNECRLAARERLREDVDLLKVMVTGGVLSQHDDPDQTHFTADELRAFVEEAHRFNVPVAAHAQGTPGIKRALQLGVDTIEHGMFLDDEAIELFLERDAVLVPTLTVLERIMAEGPEHDVPPWGIRKSAVVHESYVENIRAAHEAGVHIAAGSDLMGPPLLAHGENAIELELYVEQVGMSPRQALHTATGAAGALIDDEVGTLTPGDRADFLVLSGDPRDDIGVIRDGIEKVYKSGTPIGGG